jgi:acetyltransferase
MGIHNLDRIFKPRSVAVVGAGERVGTIGRALADNLLGKDFKGKVFPVNPRYESIHGVRAYPSLSRLPEPADLAVIAVPIAQVPSLVEECGKVGVGGAVIISAGGKEAGERGRRIEIEIKNAAEKGGVRIIGPNCMGIISAESKLNASFAREMPLAGNLAFISQSGAICGAILDLSYREAIGFSHFVSIGSMLDVDFGDLIYYMGNDPRVGSIVLYIESLTNIRKFMSAARAVSRVKPIVVLKAGKSRAGAKAASSHTGALAGEDAVYDAAFKRAGVVRVGTIEELFDCAELMAKQPPPSGPGLAIMTNGGGPGVMAVDALATHGLEPAPLGPETLERLNRFLPPYWSKGNPIDILGDASTERWRKALEVCLSAREFNALVIIFIPQLLTDAATVAQAVASCVQDTTSSRPLFAVWMGGENVEEGRRILNKAGIPTYETPERAVLAFHDMYSYAQNLETLQEIPPKLDHSLEFDRSAAESMIRTSLNEGHPLLTELESKSLLRAYGIHSKPMELARSESEAATLAGKIGYPVVMKIHSRQILHKSDVHGVRLDLRNEEEVREAFFRMTDQARLLAPGAEILGVTLQPMIPCPDFELIMGSKRDPDFGPVLLFGIGGVLTEVLRDRALALPPLNRLLARRLMESTRVYRVLKGYRNRPPARLEALEEVLMRLSQLVIDFPEISELDVNPMVLAGDQVIALDARVILKPSELRSPHHLVISPYPNQYERTVTAKGGINLFIRPIKPEDAPLLVDLFHLLSRQTIYYRFFSPIKSLSGKMLALLTQIDYDLDMALVAIDASHPEEGILAVSRLMREWGGQRAEFAVVVGDPWQGKGIGAVLMESLIEIAKERGIESLWGYVLAENTQMLALGKKLGFTISRAPEPSQYKLEIRPASAETNP